MLAATVGAQKPAKPPSGAPRRAGAAAPALVQVQHVCDPNRRVGRRSDHLHRRTDLCAEGGHSGGRPGNAERLPLTGLELLGAEVERDASIPDRVIHRMRYRVVAYEPEAPSLGIGAIPVRYFIQQAGKKAEDVIPAGEVKVPPLALSLRSTIPEGVTAELRDDRSVYPLPRWVQWARPVGFGLVALAIVPVALWGAGLVLRAQAPGHEPAGRGASRGDSGLPHCGKSRGWTSAPRTRCAGAYAQLDAWVRTNLQQATGVPALALTPAEIGAAPTRRPKRMEQVQRVLRSASERNMRPRIPRRMTGRRCCCRPKTRWVLMRDEYVRPAASGVSLGHPRGAGVDRGVADAPAATVRQFSPDFICSTLISIAPPACGRRRRSPRPRCYR